MQAFKLFLFGEPRLVYDGKLIEIGLRKAAALLAYLRVTQKGHSRDALAALFWPEQDQSSARASLRRTLHRLKGVVGEGIVTADGETVALDSRVDLWLDVEEFTQSVRDCEPTGTPARDVDPECLSRLTNATALYSDDFLAGFTLPDSAAFDEWQFFEAERLRQSLRRILIRLIDIHASRLEFSQAIEYARRWLGLDPLDEAAHRELMRLYTWTGQQAAALRQYQQCARILEEELGLAPQPETQALYENIRMGREALSREKSFIPPETQYVRGGDVYIAYQVLGEGNIDLVFVGGFVSHLEHQWDEPGLRKFLQRLASFSRLILFDKRGVGLSDRVGYPPNLQDTMEDIRAVMEAVGSDRAVVLGASEGGTASALFAATYPDRVRGLILYGALAKGTKSADYPWALTAEQYDQWLGQLMVNWGAALNLGMFAPSRAEDERLARWWAKGLRLGSSPGEVRAVLEVMRDVDIRAALPAIHVPTLVIHRSGDRAIRVGGGRYMASQIPDAKYVELPGEDHWWWTGDAERILDEVENFVNHLGR